MKQLISTLFIVFCSLTYIISSASDNLEPLTNAVESACPSSWQSLNAEVADHETTTDHWQADITDRTQFIDFLTQDFTNRNLPVPSQLELQQFADDIAYVGKVCAAEKVKLTQVLHNNMHHVYSDESEFSQALTNAGNNTTNP